MQLAQALCQRMPTPCWTSAWYGPFSVKYLFLARFSFFAPFVFFSSFTQFGTLRLIKLKNPWNKGRWKGSYSPGDATNWTDELKKALQYNPQKEAQGEDNGEFWIDVRSLQKFYDVVYLNWNPEAFKYSTAYHYCWNQVDGPVKDTYNIGANPQYSLQVKCAQPCSVRLLLSRHITSIDDFANNKEYITLHVYRSGKRCYYPDDPFIMGTKINSPHYMVSLELPAGEHALTLVVSQYEKANTIRYTLRSYSTVPLKLRPLPFLTNEQKIVSQWSTTTAGGSPNDSVSFEKNPKFSFMVGGDDEVFVKLEARKQCAVGLCVRAEGQPSISSKAYRPGFGYLEFSAKRSVNYTIIPSAFNKGEEGPFFLTVACKSKYVFKPLPP
eukprot:m.626527 g.626527  ORF g.626527 m.626527 type:complete len:382 (-) comp58243_c0_seq1:61-1206(-)